MRISRTVNLPSLQPEFPMPTLERLFAEPVRTERDADVIVLGAGIAAAHKLRQRGLGAIVLEGRPDRIGGRIWTNDTWSDAPIDLGAAWLTHMTWSPLAALVQNHGIGTAPSELLNFTLREANGTP